MWNDGHARDTRPRILAQTLSYQSHRLEPSFSNVNMRCCTIRRHNVEPTSHSFREVSVQIKRCCNEWGVAHNGPHSFYDLAFRVLTAHCKHSTVQIKPDRVDRALGVVCRKWINHVAHQRVKGSRGDRAARDCTGVATEYKVDISKVGVESLRSRQIKRGADGSTCN